MELYKRNHPHKPRRTCNSHQTKPNFRRMNLEEKTTTHLTMDLLNSNAPAPDMVGSWPKSQFQPHNLHRLHCPGLLGCDQCCNKCSNSSSSLSNAMKIQTSRAVLSEAVAADEDLNTTSLINDDDLDCGCKVLMHNSSRNGCGKHLDFGCECGGGTNYKDDNDNGVKTLANCCDTLEGYNKHKLMQDGIEGEITEGVQPRCSAIMTRWRDGLSTCIHRCVSLFSGRPPLPFRRSKTESRNWSSSVLNTTTQWTRMTSFLTTFAIVLITCLPNLPVSYACSSRSTPKPRPPSPTLRPNITIQTYTCPPEYDAHYCLNGATCFTVKIGESILYNCECAEGYMGQRCEFKDLDGSYLPSKQRAMLEQAGVSGAVAIVIILVVVVLGYAYVRQSRRKSLARHAREGGDQVDGFVFERRPFSQYYYNNPSISISQDLHRQSRSPRCGVGSLDMPPRVASTSISPPSSSPHQEYSPQRSSPHQTSPSTPPQPQTTVPLHSAKKSKPPDPPRRQT